MKNTIIRFTKLSCALAVGLMVSQGQLALAGWTGTMNGTGYGQASVNVRAVDTSLLKKRTVTTVNMQDPSASIAPTTGYATNALLPDGASAATVAKVKGTSGYIWQATTVGSDGDSTDNAELESRVRITAADCASLEMTSSAVIAPAGDSGTITVNAKATAGTALWLRGIEFNGDRSELPNDDPETEVNETIEFLKTNVNSSLKWDVLLVGPFDLNTASCSALTIPFTIETSPENLYFVSDGVAKSLPLLVNCPNDKVVGCNDQPVAYETSDDRVTFAGCGVKSIVFDPPQGTLFPVGTHTVTVTATDKDDNQKSCTFNVTVTDNEAPVVPNLPTLTGECSVTATPPTATDNCAGSVVGTTSHPLTYTLKGTYTITWTFDDKNGNIVTKEQTVIVTGLSFNGFYSPIGGTGGTCNEPLRTTKLGNNLPVKFDVACNGSPVVTGRPRLTLKQCSGGNFSGEGDFQLVGNEWHFNWDTTGRTLGVYELTATLQDGSTRTVFIKLK